MAPYSTSLPAPPFSVSFPGPPQMMSLPPPPFTVSLPAPAQITSAPAVPMMVLLALLPAIVARRPAHSGMDLNTTSRKVSRLVGCRLVALESKTTAVPPGVILGPSLFPLPLTPPAELDATTICPVTMSLT